MIAKKMYDKKRAEGKTDEEIAAAETEARRAKLFAATAHLRGEDTSDDTAAATAVALHGGAAADSEYCDTSSTTSSNPTSRATISSRPSSRAGAQEEAYSLSDM